MSSVGSADRSADDRVRRTREEYENREAEQAKKKAAELKRLHDRHQEELENTKAVYENRLDNLKSRSQTLLSERDQEHQEDIEFLRQMYRDQLKKKVNEIDNSRVTQVEAYENEMLKEKKINELQLRNLTNNHRNEISERDRFLTRRVNEYQDQARKAVVENRDRLNQTHQKDINAISKQRDEYQSESAKKMMEMKNYYNQKIDDLKRQQRSLDSKWQDRFTSEVKQSQNDFGEHSKDMSDQLKAQREELRGDYDFKLREGERRAEISRKHYEEDLGERNGKLVRSKNYQINELENRLNRQISRAEKQKEAEKKNLILSYENRLADLQEQKEGAFDVLREINKERLMDEKQSSQKMLNEVRKYYKGEIGMKNLKHKMDRESLENMKNERVSFVEAEAARKTARAEMTAEERVAAMEKYFEEAKTQLREDYQEKVEKGREKQAEGASQLNRVMTERFRQIEKNFRDRFDFAIQGYESKISQMKQDHEKEVQRLQSDHKRQLADQTKGLKTEKKSVEGRYEDRIASMEEQHRQEVERMNQQHQKDLKDLALKLNSYNRKA